MPYRYTTDVPGWQHDMMRDRANDVEKAAVQNFVKQKNYRGAMRAAADLLVQPVMDGNEEAYQAMLVLLKATDKHFRNAFKRANAPWMNELVEDVEDQIAAEKAA